MYCEPLQKPKKKLKYKYKPVNAKVIAIVTERSGGICEYCHSNTATAPHHIKLKSQGGLDIPINILHICDSCHDHSNTKFLHDAKEILRDRVQEMFKDSEVYTLGELSNCLSMSRDEVLRQCIKDFLKISKAWPTGEEIKLWLGVA